MSFVALAEKLKTILETVQTNNPDTLSAVFDYDVPGPVDGYPYACVANQDAEEQPLDSDQNKALYTFILRVVDVATDKTQSEARMRSLADAILAELRKRANATFGGVASTVFPFKTTWRWSAGSDVIPQRILEIEVSVEMCYSIS